jgi:hypothetical protein
MANIFNLDFFILALDGIYFPTMSIKISIISLGAHGITAIVAQPQQNALSILDIATLAFMHFRMQLQHLDFYKSVSSKE